MGRKPLLLKGARQVGKTYILKKFGAEHFPACHYLNFEKQKHLSPLFKKDLDPHAILEELQFFLGHPIHVKNDLVIFDEVQDCPEALTSLKYFQEEIPELAVCAAGSLLGVHLSHASFPVGKVDFLDLRPLSFKEFLRGCGENQLHDLLLGLGHNDTIPDMAHTRLWRLLKIYFVTGGLPEIVTLYHQEKENQFTALQGVREKQESLVLAHVADIAKHSGKINAMHVERLWKNIPAQLARSQDGSAQKFRFKGILPGISRYERLAGAIDWLQGAGLVIKIPIVNSGQVPLSAYAQENRFKLYLFDVGLLGSLSQLSPKTILDYDYGTYKGYFAENFVAQELLASSSQALYAWNEGTAELEFLRDDEGQVLPIEVKSGWVTQSKSLGVFAAKYCPPVKTIFSANNLKIDIKNGLHRLPLYLAGRFPLK